MMGIITILLYIASAWALRFLFNGLANPLRHVPGPYYTLFTNLPLKFYTLTARRIYYINDLHEKYGDIVRIAPREVSCRDPSMFREIHRVGGGFAKTEWYPKFIGIRTAEEHSIFSLGDPKQHAARRKLLARPFSKSELRRVWGEEVRAKVLYAVSRMKDSADAQGGEVDVLHWWILMAADVASRLAFGECFNMLETGKKHRYIEAVERIGFISSLLAELPFLRLMQYAPSSAWKEAITSQETIFKWAELAVANSKKIGSTANIFSGVMAEVEKGNGISTDQNVRTDASTLIIAGSDTTAITMTYIVWNVLSRPQLHQQLVAEVQMNLDDNLHDRQLEALPIMNAVIQETLRLHVAVPDTLPRHPPSGGISLGGYYIPENVTVGTQAWSLHRNPRFWANPDEFVSILLHSSILLTKLDRFDINRWLPDGRASEAIKNSFHPFGGGSRVCLGLHLAEMELRYATAAFFRAYPAAKLSSRTTLDSMQPISFFVASPKAHQCWVSLF